MNLENITNQVVVLAREVGEFIRIESKKFSSEDIIEKGVHNLVTYVDKESEKQIVKALKKILPEAGFIAEENQALERKKQYNWIIDPLDGTTNFVHGLPPFSVSIALADKDEIITGVIYEINLDECFYAWKDGPAFLNNKQIKVSKTKLLDNSLIATGFPYYDYSLMKPYLELLSDLMHTSRGVRRLGSAAVDLAYVACGRFDLFYEYSLNPWDVAAGIIIVQRAGGTVTDFRGGNDFLFGKQIIASNNLIHQEFDLKMKQHFKD
ncbi:MAG TPA: inositol monophosphatase family protein [Bacteroidales bacterium]